jgi:hypothetical protein
MNVSPTALSVAVMGEEEAEVRHERTGRKDETWEGKQPTSRASTVQCGM